MRVIEGLIFAFAVPTSLWLFQSELPSWMAILVMVAMILVPFHAWLEGMHWQMAPAYIAVGILLLWDLGGHLDVSARPYCALVTCLLLSSSLFFFWALPMFKLPKPTGKYPVGTRMLYLMDTSRAEMHAGARPGNREVVVQLWYPAATGKGRRAKYRLRSETSRISSYQSVLATHALQDASVASGRFPVIVYNPAWFGLRHRETFIMQELASHGFVVAAISHPYNSSMVKLSDGTVAHPDYSLDIGYSKHHYIPLEKRLEIAEEELTIQTEDCRFLLDELQRFNRTGGHYLESHLQMDRVGAQGVSFGGAVSMEFAMEDARVLSAVGLDGVLHGSVARDGLDKPFMFIDCPLRGHPFEIENDEADVRVIETAGMWKQIADNKTRLLSRCGGIRVLVDGIGKSDFYDEIFMSPLRRLSRAGSVPRKRVVFILNAYIVAFFRQTLCNVEGTILAGGAQSFPEATLKVWQRAAAECMPDLTLPYVGSEML